MHSFYILLDFWVMYPYQNPFTGNIAVTAFCVDTGSTMFCKRTDYISNVSMQQVSDFLTYVIGYSIVIFVVLYFWWRLAYGIIQAFFGIFRRK